MKKKGFTLIEIIICITLITIIGTASFFGIRFVNKQIKISKLEQITDRAIQAAQVYLETNEEANKQLYSNSNGISVPLQLLVNEGLLNIDNTDLTINDLKDEYVVTFLGGSGGTENCEQITSSASWANDKPIYLCMNSNGSSNLAFIDPTKYGNLTTVSKEPYIFKGNNPDNYVLLPGKTISDTRIRIYKIDRDDSIWIYYGYSDFNSIELNEINFKKIGSQFYYYGHSSSGNYAYMLRDAYCKAMETCVSYEGGTTYKTTSVGFSATYIDVFQKLYVLQPCWKISGGTGSFESPFTLTSTC